MLYKYFCTRCFHRFFRLLIKTLPHSGVPFLQQTDRLSSQTAPPPLPQQADIFKLPLKIRTPFFESCPSLKSRTAPPCEADRISKWKTTTSWCGPSHKADCLLRSICLSQWPDVLIASCVIVIDAWLRIDRLSIYLSIYIYSLICAIMSEEIEMVFTLLSVPFIIIGTFMMMTIVVLWSTALSRGELLS